MTLIDKSGFIRRGGHRVSLRRLSETGSLTHRECSDVMLQNYTEMALLDPPLVNIEGDDIIITAAGTKALSEYHEEDRPAVPIASATHLHAAE